MGLRQPARLACTLPDCALRRLAVCTQVTFRDPYRYRHQKENFIAAEGIYSGQVNSSGAHGLAAPGEAASPC